MKKLWWGWLMFDSATEDSMITGKNTKTFSPHIIYSFFVTIEFVCLFVCLFRCSWELSNQWENAPRQSHPYIIYSFYFTSPPMISNEWFKNSNSRITFFNSTSINVFEFLIQVVIYSNWSRGWGSRDNFPFHPWTKIVHLYVIIIGWYSPLWGLCPPPPLGIPLSWQNNFERKNFFAGCVSHWYIILGNNN